jgi:ribonuclease R
MTTLEKSILAVFKNNPTKLLNYKQVAARLDLEADPKEVSAVLDKLVLEEKIAGLDRGKYHFIHQSSQIEGYVEITQRGSGYLICDDEGTEDVFIASSDLKHAFHGDKVLVNLYAQKSGKRLEGEVVEILERRKKNFVGTIQVSKDFAFVVSDDKKVYVDFYIPKEDLNGAEDGQKVIVKLKDWPDKAKNPYGKIVEVLGNPGENETEMHAIVAEFGFATQFPDDVLKEANAIKEKISKEEIAKRRDFRNTLTFTIDPEDAKDFDDAISYRIIDSELIEVGVHIADVSHYVVPGTKLDEDAFNRATSVYLVDRTIPMLPENISNFLCSLRPNEDKLCFAAVFHLNRKGEIHHEWFGKTIIHSQKRFAYEEAQEIIEGKQDAIFSDVLETLNNIAKELKEKRFKAGAISFETEEVKFRLDDEGKPIEVYKKIRKDAHKLIEEYMLLANRKVAEFVYKKAEANKKSAFPFVYRVHDLPNTDKVIEFNKFIKRFGFQIKTDSEIQIAKSINQLLHDAEGKPELGILQSMAIRTMAKAIYTSKKSSHYGLAFDYYTHFTSPIRRYPDLLAHRFLYAYLNGEKIHSKEIELLEKKCKHSSDMEQKAAEAERASTKYKQAEYLQSYVGRVFSGVISGVTEWGIYVELSENKCEGLVRLNTLFDDHYLFDEDQRIIVGKRNKKKFQIGDPVRVQVKKSDPIKRTIDFTLVIR